MTSATHRMAQSRRLAGARRRTRPRLHSERRLLAALSAEQQVDLADRARTIPPVRLPSLAELQLRRGGLTPAQDVVFRLVSDGHSAKQIAALLGRSIKTVDAHMVAVHRVMGAGDRVVLARYAIRLGLVEV